MNLRTYALLSVTVLLAWAGLAVALDGTAAPPAPLAPPAPTTTPTTGPVELIYLFSPTCEKCKQAAKMVDALVVEYGNRIKVHRLSVLDPEALERAIILEERYKVKPAAPPRIFIGSTCLTGLDEITDRLAAVVAREIKSAASQPEDHSTSQPVQ